MAATIRLPMPLSLVSVVVMPISKGLMSQVVSQKCRKNVTNLACYRQPIDHLMGGPFHNQNTFVKHFFQVALSWPANNCSD